MESPMNFYLSTLEEQARCELSDNEATLTQSSTEGRVLLDVQEDILANILDLLQEKRESVDWSQEKQKLLKEICGLRAQQQHLSPAQSHQQETLTTISNLHSQLELMKKEKEALVRELDTTRSQLRTNARSPAEARTNNKLENQLRCEIVKAQKHLEHQARIIRLLQHRSAQAEQQKCALLRQLEAAKLDMDHILQFCALSTNLELELESVLKAEQLQAQKNHEQQSSLLKRLQDRLKQMEDEKEASQAQLGKDKKYKNQLAIALKRAQEEHKTKELQWQEEKSTLTAQLHRLQAHLAEPNLQETNRNCLAAQKLKFDLKLQKEHQEWEKERTALQQENDNLTAALKNAKDRLKKHRNTWQEEWSTLTSRIDKLQESHEAQLKLQETNRNNYLAAQKIKFDLKLQEEQQGWDKERTALQQKNDNLAADLQNAEDELQKQCNMWQEELSTLTSRIDELQESHEAQLKLQEDSNKNFVSVLKKTFEDQLQNDYQRWHKERISLLQETEKARVSYEAQLKDKQQDNNALSATLKNAQEELQSNSDLWQEERSTLTSQLDRLRETHLVQLQTLDNDHKNLATAQRTTFDDQLRSDRLLWQQEKNSLRHEMEQAGAAHEAQLRNQQEDNSTLTAALTKAESELQRHTNMWQEEKASLLQATESLRVTLLEKEQAEASLTSQLEDLQSQVDKKKKKRKWYKLF
ncbi:myosin heavy chain, clone 203-like [Plectropomus leopardus]|uniref:myosin heavy chain, clone 203-like n=1 Tax=Plectropomus leopardus TaxID=160734 RepID=UPI001C4BABB4|nr:myosin heavy chain, clone 203-like [Plectropomus leopardus]